MLRVNHYDAIVFVHGTGREKSTIIAECIESFQNPEIQLFYVKNEYNLGENNALWVLCRDYDFEYTMISNHVRSAEKRCKKWIKDWHTINLNALIYEERNIDWVRGHKQTALFPMNNSYGMKEFGLIYYGTLRPDRMVYFKKYIDERAFFSTSMKNRKYVEKEFNAKFIDKLASRDELIRFKYSLYIEDEHTHKHYNHLANRYYECLANDVILFFSDSCIGTIEKSGYDIDSFFIIHSKEGLHEKINFCEESLGNFMEILQLQSVNKNTAKKEKLRVLDKIEKIVNES
jgi:hypothetical protein